MARVQTPPILSQIRTARTVSDQNAAIRSLKNDIIGHVERQQKAVELGALDTLVHVLESSRPPMKPNGKDTRTQFTASRPLSEHESVRLQVIQLLASFAHGGPPFLTPLHSAGAIPALLANLCPIDNPPRIVLATLRTLVSLAEAATFGLPPCAVDLASLADEVFTPAHLDSLSRILVEPGSIPSVSVHLVNGAAGLIGCLCREECHQLALANSGLLDALATRLAGFVVARGFVVPEAEKFAQKEGIWEFMPEPAPNGTSLTAVLDAISAIIADSRLRACMLLYSPSILCVFPSLEFDAPARDIKAAWDAVSSVGLGSSRPQPLGAMDYLLPIIPGQARSSSSQITPFPPVASTRDHATGRSNTHPQTFSGWDSSRLESAASSAEDPEVPLIPWLIYVTRSNRGLESLAAASVLTSLHRAGFASRSREAALGTLVIPPLVELLTDRDGDSKSSPATALSHSALSTWVDAKTSRRWAVVARALAVLARLTTDNELLQKAAHDCSAIKIVSKLLKDAYEPLPTQEGPKTWSPSRRDERARLDASDPGHALGLRGQLPIQRHRDRLRELALKLIASLMSFKEDYRKAFVEQDLVPYIVESLSESPSKPGGGRDRSSKPSALRASPDNGNISESASVYGQNSVPVLVAACHAVRMLARSPGIIRTTLQDASVAPPLFRLTRHPDVQVQVAATGVLCNLLIVFSPMRERLMELGIMKVICEHAHSTNAALRLNAVWSLKHLADGLSTDLKKACVEELQPGWLVQLICDDTEDEALFSRTRAEKQTSHATTFDGDDDVEMVQLEEDIGQGARPATSAHSPASPRLSHERSRTGRLRQAESKIVALRDAELNPVRKARNDDLAIQEQALHFIRNLLTTSSTRGDDSERDTTDMVDFLFSQLGQDRLFEILASKLRVKVLHPFSRRSPGASSGTMGGNGSIGSAGGGSSSRVLYPQAKIIEPVVYILVHIAASEPRHRQLVIAQTELLKALSTHFSSRDKEVRVALCHLVFNLTWQDDAADNQAADRRAEELRRLGMLSKLESLQQDDTELDVRERAKMAVCQMKHPHRGGGGDIGGG